MTIYTNNNFATKISCTNDDYHVDKHRMRCCARNRTKRCIDFTIALLFLCSFFLPILLLVSLCVCIESRGGVFFVQKRTGQFGKTFNCYKFRTMRLNKEADHVQATQNDYRTTKVGRFLRQASIDELPQVINVLKGDMSFIGPRPHMLKHTNEFTQSVANYSERHFVRPGITGMAQITGFRGEIITHEDIVGRVNADIWYINNWTLLLDVKIVLSTIKLLIVRNDNKAY